MALALGISAGLSRVRLHRARKALSEHFQAVNLGMKHPTQFMMSRFVDGDLPAGTVAWLRDLHDVARTLRLPRSLPAHISEDMIRRRRARSPTPGD